MNHCSSEGATAAIKSYLSSRPKFQFKTKISKPKTILVQFQIKIHFNFISISISKIIFQNSFSILHQILIQIKREETIHLSDLWEHTITKIFKHDPESELGIKIRQWEIYNKLEDFNSLLNYTDKDFTPHGGGNLSFCKENGDSVVKTVSPTPLQELITSGGIFNISLMKVGIYMMMMNPIIL